MMSLPEKESGKLGFSEDRVHPFRPLDRNEFSENALLLLDRYRVDNANDPMAIFVSIVDKMSIHQRGHFTLRGGNCVGGSGVRAH